MVFITGYIVFNSSSQFVTNDTAYFENSMDYFKERGFDCAASLKYIMWKR